ncbi:LOB domain-containing protein 36 [Spatholobus suberectus]|nr:LOB domain-containing protein 36 [Spatholobus suberectus]
MSSSNSPCAACKLLRRKCTQECVFAPYFPPDNPQRFACVHRVFGASNVAKLLNELSLAQREDAVKSLAYEAEARLRDPVYGCVGFISLLQQRLRQIQTELHSAKKELSTYVSPQAMQVLLANPGMLPPSGPHLHQSVLNNNCGGNNAGFVGHGGGQMVIRDPQQQEFLEAQQMALAAREHQQQQQQQVMLRNYEQQQEFMKLNGGLEHGGGGGFGNQVELLSPSLALGGFENIGSYQIQQQGEHAIEAQLLLSPQQQSQEQPHQHQQCESEDARSVVPA